MKAPAKFVRRCAPVFLLALHLACGGSDATGPNPPATVTANSATTLSGSPGAAVQDRPSVVVRDQSGNPSAGVSVTFAVTGGGGTLTGPSQVTNASGVATVGSWTLGPVFGANAVTASVASLPPVLFTATSLDPCTRAASAPHTFGTSTNGELTTLDCFLQNGLYRDLFSTTVSTAGAYVFTQTAGFDAFLVLFGSDGFPIGFNDDESGSLFSKRASPASRNSRIKAFLPAGNYFLGATSFVTGATGTYTIASASTSHIITGCEVVFAARGITTSQSLEGTDCWLNSRNSDDVLVFLRAGQTLNVSMTSSAFDAFLELWEFWADSAIAFNDDADATTDNAVLSYAAAADGWFFVVPTSTVAGATGAYTLTIQ